MIKSRMRWAGHVARLWERRGAYRILVGKLEGTIPLTRSRNSGWIILKWGFRKCDGGMEWIDLAHYRSKWGLF